ncbi:MAG: hypothetical protein COB66_01380 [Coxiella sp. (in: Bacteria)]|nr:MAG: hypothetical protein COB66_01380 [Coxiella sp. (in: g-proteobacteria)]
MADYFTSEDYEDWQAYMVDTDSVSTASGYVPTSNGNFGPHIVSPSSFASPQNYKEEGKWHLYLDNPVGFGKHRHDTLKEVIDTDKEYFSWMRDNDVLEITASIKVYLGEQLEVPEEEAQEILDFDDDIPF